MRARLEETLDFLRDYAKGIPLDWLIWTKSGHAALWPIVAALGALVSLIVRLLSIDPAWKHDSLIALDAFLTVALVSGVWPLFVDSYKSRGISKNMLSLIALILIGAGMGASVWIVLQRSPVSTVASQQQQLSWNQTATLVEGFKDAKRVFEGPVGAVVPPQTCRVRINAAVSNSTFQSQVEAIGSWICDVIPPPWVDLTSADIVPTPAPTIEPYIIIRAASPQGPPPTRNPEDTQTLLWYRESYANQAADVLVKSFRNIGLDARRSKILRNDHDPTIIYIELGNITPWK